MVIKKEILEFVVVPESKVIIEKFKDDVSLKSLICGSNAIWSHLDYKKEFNIIVDLREAKVTLAISDIPKLMAFYRKNELTSTGKMAILVENPVSTAISFLVRNRFSFFMRLSVYSLPENAAKQIGITLEEFERINRDCPSTRVWMIKS